MTKFSNRKTLSCEREEEFWMNVRHIKELTLDDAREFIMTKYSEEEADEILKRLGRTDYIQNRLFDDQYEDKEDGHYGSALFAHVSGITVESVKNVLEENYPSDSDAFDTSISNLELKYNDPGNFGNFLIRRGLLLRRLPEAISRFDEWSVRLELQ